MKFIMPFYLLQAALLAALCAGAARADDTEASGHSKIPPYSKAALQGKIEFCQTCHGPSGEGARGASTIPRLAGQQAKYLENQLRNFIVHRRTNNVMSNAVQQMGPAEIAALAAYFSGLNPKPLAGAPGGLAVAGKKIYDEGNSEAGVPACASCHGPDAKGVGVVPRLAGQLDDYVVKKLGSWEKERGQDPSVPAQTEATMKSVSHNLSGEQVAAVSAYLSSLE
jgi:cytochrome c553